MSATCHLTCRVVGGAWVLVVGGTPPTRATSLASSNDVALAGTADHERSATDMTDAKRHGGSQSYRSFDDSGSDTEATNAERIERRRAPRQQQ
jgi:hypothetical protein